MLIKRIIGSLLFVALITVLAGCGGGSSTPVVETPITDKTAITGDEIDFEITPLDGATYSWTCSEGDFLTATTGYTVRWLAPKITEPQTVTVTITDSESEISQLTWTVDVLPWVVDANITSPTTWEGTRVYLVEPTLLTINSTLDIEAGCIIKFKDTAGSLDLLPSGVITADGTASDQIVFTSYKDDFHGGDTNKDGLATSPSRGDWNMITTNEVAGSTFNYCDFLWAGHDTYGVLEIQEPTTVTNCTFAYINSSDSAGALNAGDALAGCVITGNEFVDTTYPLTLNVSFSLDDSNTFSANDYNGIWLWNEQIGNTVNWQETEVPFVVRGDCGLSVAPTGALSLGSDVVIKFGINAWMSIYGSCIKDASGVYFTSYLDDSLKGDTNNCNGLLDPANGDWDGILLGSPVDDYANWANILYAANYGL